VASNGEQTGKFLLQNQSSDPLPILSDAWVDIGLSPSSGFFINDENSSFNFIISNTSWSVPPNIKGFNGDKPSDGLNGYIRNAGPGPLILKHNQVNTPGITIPFFLSSGSNYSISENEILGFKYSSERNRCEISVYDLNAIVPLTPFSEVFLLKEADVSQPNITLILSHKPNLNDFINVFINGVYINSDDLIIVDSNIIIAKSNIEYVVREGMKVTVNYKY